MKTTIVAATLGLLAPMSAAARPMSPHEAALWAHRGTPPFGKAEVVPPPGPIFRSRDGSEPVVIGYLPYWMSPETIDWARLDVLAYFSVGVEADGSLGNDHGWGDEGADALIEAAHVAGARVTLSATRFGGAELGSLLNDAAARANAIDNLVGKMVAGGGDGLDIDFEGLRVAERDEMVTFVQDLRAALDAAQPGALLTLATPAIDWSGAWDYDVIASSSDYLFIMGYAFHGSWGDPGPQAPLDGSDLWGNTYCLRWSVRDYLEWGGAGNASRFVLGLPLYGYSWESTSGEAGASSSGGTSAVFWDEAHALAGEHGRLWDAASTSPWIAWESGGWNQVWYDDVESIRAKAEMARDEGIGGFGFWALEYDAGDADLWNMVGDVRESWVEDEPGDDDTEPGDDDSAEPGAPVIDVDAPSVAMLGEVVELDASSSYDPEGASLFFGWVQVSGPSERLLAADTARASFVATTIGEHVFRVTVSDGSLEAEAEVRVRVLPASTVRDDSGIGCSCAEGGGAAFLLAIPWSRRRRHR